MINNNTTTSTVLRNPSSLPPDEREHHDGTSEDTLQVQGHRRHRTDQLCAGHCTTQVQVLLAIAITSDGIEPSNFRAVSSNVIFERFRVIIISKL